MTDFVFIDSGVGGIPYMMKLLEKKNDASCIYVADTKNFPYGEKTHEQVIESVLELAGKICERFSPKVIVVACNTMSVNALEEVREKYPDIQFVGTVPAIKLAASLSKKRRIGLLATKATCENPYNFELKDKFAADCELFTRGDGKLVSFIEHNAFTASREECLEAVKPAVEFFRAKDCDAVILGCTHFLNFTDVFKAACEPDIKVVDSVDGVVRHALEVLGSGFEVSGKGTECEPAGGVAGVSPVRRGSEQRSASGGKAFPTLYITGFRDREEENQYNVLCSRFGIQFGGLLKK